MRLDLCFSFRLDVLRHFHFAVSHPTFRAGPIAVRRSWFLSCDHYGNLASFLLLIYDLVNMPACQMVLFFRLGDNEINKNCCKKQRGGGFFSLNGPLFISTNVPGRPRPRARWDSKQVKGSQRLWSLPQSEWFPRWGTAPCLSFPTFEDTVDLLVSPQNCLLGNVNTVATLYCNCFSFCWLCYELPGAKNRGFSPLPSQCLAQGLTQNG